MSYRKINVDGKPYDYVVGKDTVKVRDVSAEKPVIVGVWPKEEVGHVIDDWNVQVQPVHIATKIRNIVL